MSCQLSELKDEVTLRYQRRNDKKNLNKCNFIYLFLRLKFYDNLYSAVVKNKVHKCVITQCLIVYNSIIYTERKIEEKQYLNFWDNSEKCL